MVLNLIMMNCVLLLFLVNSLNEYNDLKSSFSIYLYLNSDSIEVKLEEELLIKNINIYSFAADFVIGKYNLTDYLKQILQF